MRVVYLSASGHLGGAERCLLDLVAEIRQTHPGWSLHVLLGAPGPLSARLSTLGVVSTVLAFPDTVARLGETGDSFPTLVGKLAIAGVSVTGYLRELKHALRTLAPDVIHSNGLKMHALAGRAAPAGVPVIWHLHDYIGRRPLTRRLLRLNRRRCAAIIANSASVAADAREVIGPDCEIHPVPNGVDLTAFSPDGATLDLDRLAGLTSPPTPVVRVGLVATMARWKGHELFLQALARIPATSPIRAYVIGGPIYQTDASQHSIEELKHHARRAGLAGRVGFTGFVEDAAAAMRALDIVVHASTAPEPFGLVVAEAMACGRAMVMSPASGAVEHVEPDHDVLIFPAADVDALARRIQELAGDDDLRHRLGKAARATAERRFDRARMSQAVVALYESIMGLRG